MGLPILTAAGGLAQGVPDTCLVPAPPGPPIPTPFPNLGLPNTATGTTTKVLVMNMPAVTVQSQIPQSNGDQAGVGGGVVSGTIMGPISFKIGSSKVKFQGNPVVLVAGLTAHNGTNANDPAGQVVMSGNMKVLAAP